MAAPTPPHDRRRGRPRLHEADAVRVECYVDGVTYTALRRVARQRGVSVSVIVRALVRREFLPK